MKKSYKQKAINIAGASGQNLTADLLVGRSIFLQKKQLPPV